MMVINVNALISEQLKDTMRLPIGCKTADVVVSVFHPYGVELLLQWNNTNYYSCYESME